MLQVDEVPKNVSDQLPPLSRVEELIGGLWGWIGSRTCADLAEDCLQEARISLWQSREKLYRLPEGQRDAYASTCARRAVRRNLVRADIDRGRAVSIEEIAGLADPHSCLAPDPDSDRWLDLLENADLADSVAVLSAVDRAIIHLHYAQGLTNREIAAKCGLSLPAVEKRRMRLINMLRRKLRVSDVTDREAAV